MQTSSYHSPIYSRALYFSIELSSKLCNKSVEHKYKYRDLYLYSEFYSTDIYIHICISLSQYHNLLITELC